MRIVSFYEGEEDDSPINGVADGESFHRGMMWRRQRTTQRDKVVSTFVRSVKVKYLLQLLVHLFQLNL